MDEKQYYEKEQAILKDIDNATRHLELFRKRKDQTMITQTEELLIKYKQQLKEHRETKGLVYQKKFEKGPVQMEFKSGKTTIKPLGKPNKLTPVKKTELNHYGLETKDRPHLESFDVCVDKKMNDLINELEEATSNPHHSVSRRGHRVDEIVKELKKELKKIPICDENDR